MRFNVPVKLLLPPNNNNPKKGDIINDFLQFYPAAVKELYTLNS
jgi:hypothetical protein